MILGNIYYKLDNNFAIQLLDFDLFLKKVGLNVIFKTLKALKDFWKHKIQITTHLKQVRDLSPY